MQHSEKKLTDLIKDIEKDRIASIKNTLSSLSPYEIARLLESIEPRNREILWEMMDQEDEGEVLKELIEEFNKTSRVKGKGKLNQKIRNELVRRGGIEFVPKTAETL